MSYYDPDLGKKILTQDEPQVSQSTKKARESRVQKEQADYDTSVREYEKEKKDADEKYQKDLAAYNKQTADQNRKTEQQEIEDRYNLQISSLEQEREKLLDYYRQQPTIDARTRDLKKDAVAKIEFEYKKKIAAVERTKQGAVLPLILRSEGYPDYVVEKSVRGFRSGTYLTIGSASEAAERLYVGKQAQAQRNRETSIQQAQNIAAKQSAEYHGNIPNIGYITSFGLEEGRERAEAIKPTPNVITGKQAVETRRPLTGVKTVETIYGGQTIETNPRAFVASLTRQDVDAAGKPIKPKEIPIAVSPPIPSEPIQSNERWQVEIDGKIRTFQTKEAAEEYIQRRTPVQTFGPILQKQESVYLPAGSLQYLLETNQLKKDPNKLLVAKKDFSKTPLGPEKPRPLEIGIQFFGDIGKKYRDIQPIAFTAGAIEEGLGIVGGTINLIEKGKQKLGELAPIKYPIKEVKKPYSLPASPFEYPLDVGYETVFHGVPLTQAEKQARTKQVQIIKDEGGYRYSGKLAVTLATIPFKGAVRTGEKIASGLLKPAKKEAELLLQRRTASMLDIGKTVKPNRPFSYDIPYKPTTRPNEIDLSDFGEKIGPATPISKKPIAARQSDVILPRSTKSLPIKEDISYKPARRPNEIDLSRDNVLTEFKTQKIKLGRSMTPEIPLKGKISEPVKPEPLFKPARRPNEIDLSRDNVLTEFTSTRIRLGKATTPPRRFEIRGKKEKPVEEDFFYKPTTRPNEIDLSDFGEKIKLPKIEPEKSEISLDLKRELKRLKRKQPEFKSEKFPLGGEGIYLSGKRQTLLLVKRQEELTKKKLITKRKSPLSINWSEQIQTVQIPKTGKAPIQIIMPRERKKKKAYLQEQTGTIQAYDIPLSEQRPKIKTVSRMDIRSEFKLSSPSKVQESIKFETIQPQKLTARPKTITRQISTPKYETRTLQRVSPKLAQAPKLSAPLAPKAPTKLKAPQRQPLREKPVQISILRNRPPKTPKVIFAWPPTKEPIKPKERKEPKSVLGFYLGNVPESQISGMFKRKEITLGKEKIARTRRGDVRVLAGKPRESRRSKKQVDMFGFPKKKKTKFF